MGKKDIDRLLFLAFGHVQATVRRPGQPGGDGIYGAGRIGAAGLTLITSPGSAARINVVPQRQYAVVFLALFLALFWTRDERRLTAHGFWVSIVGVGVYAVQSYDVWPVFPSDAYYALMALILLAEAATIRRSLNVLTAENAVLFITAIAVSPEWRLSTTNSTRTRSSAGKITSKAKSGNCASG